MVATTKTKTTLTPKPGEPEWELDCRCPDCEFQRSHFERTFEQTQTMARKGRAS